MIKLTVKNNEKTDVLFCQEGQNLMEVLRQKSIYFPATCGGRGVCGACKIRLLEGSLGISEADQDYFSEQELDKGYRLSCKAYIKEDCTFMICENESTMSAISGELISDTKNDSGEYGIAIDIGTTTIAAALLDMHSKDILGYQTSVNHQRAYGADVITRIQKSNEGYSKELQTILQEDLLQIMYKLKSKRNGVVSHVVISANTTMIHLLMHYSCKRLGEFPYLPEYIDSIEISGRELFAAYEKDLSWKVYENTMFYIFPSISAFIGGDIVSGLYALNALSHEEPFLFLDLGTNGEAVIGNADGLICTSTAVGPAFEGGNLSCGCASVTGAIHSIQLEPELMIQTIDNGDPIGICGTGIVDGISEMLKAHLIDDTGLLEDQFFDEGFLIAKNLSGLEIRISQKDIREIQMAKAAVSAGIETLLEAFEKQQKVNLKVKNFYVAGGFGHALNTEHAKRIGLFPDLPEVELVRVGNTSLKGAIHFLHHMDTIGNEKRKIEELIKSAKQFNLAEQEEFNNRYMNHMYFKL